VLVDALLPWQADRAMVTFKKSLTASLTDDPELFGKPYGARLALVCPHPDAHDPLALGLREATRDQPIIGLDGGEGQSAAMDVGAEVWWVVEQLASELPIPMLCLESGQIELHRVNVEFAVPPSEAVDYLLRTPMHASAAVFGATIVISSDAWPSSSLTSRRFAPLITRCDA
jgi:hypothetical protein